MKPSEITVEGRHRKDLGDIEGLAASIADVGLLNPIVVDGEGRLVAGGRRLAACLLLGWDDIPVIVAMNLTEAGAALRAERDENTQRKSFLPSEIASLGRALEAVYGPEAEERHRAGSSRGGKAVIPGSQPSSDPSPRVREQVGEALGVSGAAYQRIKAVSRDAADPGLPAERQAAAASALKAMDEGVAVRAAYQQYRKEHTVQQETAGKPQGKPSRKRSAVASPDSERGRAARRAHARRVEETVARLRGVTDGLALIEDIVPTALEAMTDDDIAFDISALAATASAINRLKRLLADEQIKRKNT